MFLAALSEYDQVLVESDNEVRIIVSILLLFLFFISVLGLIYVTFAGLCLNHFHLKHFHPFKLVVLTIAGKYCLKANWSFQL